MSIFVHAKTNLISRELLTGHCEKYNESWLRDSKKELEYGSMSYHI